MSDLKHDPVINAIQKGIKDDIDFNLRAERFRATLILIYAAIDANGISQHARNAIRCYSEGFYRLGREVFKISLQDTTFRQ